MIDLERRGLLFASGPLAGPPPGEGLSILRAASIENARAMVEREPSITHGVRTFDLREWTLMEGSVGLTLRCSDRSIDVA